MSLTLEGKIELFLSMEYGDSFIISKLDPPKRILDIKLHASCIPKKIWYRLLMNSLLNG